jgi:hypothetical protein
MLNKFRAYGPLGVAAVFIVAFSSAQDLQQRVIRETPTPIEPSKWTPILPSIAKIQTLCHAHARRMAGSSQKWQEGIAVALTLELKGLADDLDPPAHTETREGVCYQLHEASTAPHAPDGRSRRLMSFKAFCEQYDERQR